MIFHVSNHANRIIKERISFMSVVMTEATQQRMTSQTETSQQLNSHIGDEEDTEHTSIGHLLFWGNYHFLSLFHYPFF